MTAQTTTLAIRDLGQGPDRVLALHCGLGRSAMWTGVSRAVAGRAMLRAPDLPGHGASPDFPPDVDVLDWAAQAVEAQRDGALHLIGHSFGAVVALRLALLAPDRAASLTLVEPVFLGAPAGALQSAHYELEKAILTTARTGGAMAAAEGFNTLWGGGTPWDKVPEAQRHAMASRMDFVQRTEPALWHDSLGMLAPGGLESITAPVTFLRGDKTVPIIAEVHATLMGRLPQAQEVVVPGAGHMVVLTHPAEVAAALVQTLDRAD